MTGPEHYREAERLIAAANRRLSGDDSRWLQTPDRRAELRADAAIHSTLALAAATALGHLVEGGPVSADRKAWIAAASEHPGEQRRISEANAKFEEAQR